MSDIEVLPGTDNRFPSVRVRILGQPLHAANLADGLEARNGAIREANTAAAAETPPGVPTRELDPANPPADLVAKHSTREISLVFDDKVLRALRAPTRDPKTAPPVPEPPPTEAEIAAAIDTAVADYVESHPPAGPAPVDLPAGVEGSRTSSRPAPPAE